MCWVIMAQDAEYDEWGPIVEYEYEEFDLDSLSPEELIKVTAEEMLNYLVQSKLEVVVNQSAYTRVINTTNTQWYQDFCAAYTKCYKVRRNGKSTAQRKKPRTYIKRWYTIHILKRMANGNCDGVYAERLMDFVEEFWEKYAGH